MIVLNKNICYKLYKAGVKKHSFFTYVKYNNISRLCVRIKKGDYLVIDGTMKGKTIHKNNANVSVIYNAYSLSELNEILKFYHRYFIIDFNHTKNKWTINKSIFKIYFMDISRRGYINDFKEISNKEFENEVDAVGTLFLFLLTSKFINLDDINN